MRNDGRSIVDVAVGSVRAVVAVAVEFILRNSVDRSVSPFLTHLENIVIVANDISEANQGIGIDIRIG